MDAFRINEQIKDVRVPYYADTSDNLSSNTLKRLGNNMLPAIKKVLDGIMEVTGLFNTGKLFVFKNCHELINETTGYMWELDRNGDPKERPVKKNDDLCDALRYGVNSWIATPPMETVGGVAIPRSGGILSGFSAKARRRRR